MIITCEACSTQFVLDDALVKPEGSKVRCSKCRHVFTAFPADRPEIEFDELEFEQDPAEPQEETDAIDIQNQDIEIEDPGKDFDEDGLDFEIADFEIDEQEPDFQDYGPKPDNQEFEFEEIENGTSFGLASVSGDSDRDTANIEISFARDDGADEDLELEELSFDMNDLSVQESSIDDLELDTKKNEAPEFEFDDDPQADLIIEDGGLDLSPEPEEDLIEAPAQQQGHIIEEQPELSIEKGNSPSNDVTLESDDTEKPDAQETHEEIEQTVSEQNKFPEDDKVPEQGTEPEDTGITTPDPDVEDNTYPPETPLAPADEEIETTTEALIGQRPLITPFSAQGVYLKRSAKKKKGVNLLVKILLVLFLLILAAYVAIIRLGVAIPVVSDIQIPFITEWLEPKQALQPPLKPVPDEPSINGRFVSNKSAGDLFIVTGRIKNPSNTAVSYIQVKGTLMTKDSTKAEMLTAYCGNVIPEETLKSGNISDITRQMGVRQGNQNTNVNIKPGASVMFMLVFSNLPDDLTNFTVEVQGFEPADK